MIIRPDRKACIQAFTFHQNRVTALLLTALFLMGLAISWRGMLFEALAPSFCH